MVSYIFKTANFNKYYRHTTILVFIYYLHTIYMISYHVDKKYLNIIKISYPVVKLIVSEKNIASRKINQLLMVGR